MKTITKPIFFLVISILFISCGPDNSSLNGAILNGSSSGSTGIHTATNTPVSSCTANIVHPHAKNLNYGHEYVQTGGVSIANAAVYRQFLNYAAGCINDADNLDIYSCSKYDSYFNFVLLIPKSAPQTPQVFLNTRFEGFPLLQQYGSRDLGFGHYNRYQTVQTQNSYTQSNPLHFDFTDSRKICYENRMIVNSLIKKFEPTAEHNAPQAWLQYIADEGNSNDLYIRGTLYLTLTNQGQILSSEPFATVNLRLLTK